jgi:ABC-type polysaccharide/polyol phosphate transport system ATPase subunit
MNSIGAKAIEVSHVSKVYRRYGRRRQFATLKSAILQGSLISDLKADETFQALNDVSFSVPAGSTFGIIGRNGSGKSTMLKCVAGIAKPTSGTVKVKGRISALIELGAGFHPEISGRENVFINGIMLGLSKREIARRFDEIVEFAELKDFIDAPVKTYSSGMYMRLGFAVAIHVNPDVLLVDEVLAVGDEAFAHKCLDKFGEFRRRGKTVLIVTHSLGLVERFCDEALWIDAGRVAGQGDPRRVVGAYVTDVEKSEEAQLAANDQRAKQAVTQTVASPTESINAGAGATVNAPSESLVSEAAAAPAEPEGPPDMFQAAEGRWGSREVEIANVELLDDRGQPSHIFHSGDRLILRMDVRAAQPVTDFVFGVGLFNADGVCCYGTNTDVEQYVPRELSGDGRVEFVIDSLDLTEGTYKLDVAVHKRDGVPYDYHRLLYTFRIKSHVKDVGIFRPPHSWGFSSNIKVSATETGASHS